MTENLYAQLLGGIILGSGFYLAVTKDSPLSGTTGTVLIVLKKIN